MTAARYDVAALTGWAGAILTQAGAEADKARATAETLVEGDVLGHDTHGLFLLAPYLDRLADGVLSGKGRYDVVSDLPAAAAWDGGRLLGPWLVREAIDAATRKARACGTGTVAIRRSGHIACLAAYLEAPARTGLMVEIFSSDPSEASVAPTGGREAVFTPNPLAVGIPTDDDPIMIDVSTSITTNGMSNRLAAEGARFPGRWLLDGGGAPTDDPAVFRDDPPGTIQLLGGADAGHKGYGLTLMVEALTGGLAGYGRADGHKGWGATVTVRITDPAAFGGLDAFARQTGWLALACRGSAPIVAGAPVRLPGERGLASKRGALDDGLTLHPVVEKTVQAIGARFDAPPPT